MASKMAAVLLLTTITHLVLIRRGSSQCFILIADAKQQFHLDILLLRAKSYKTDFEKTGTHNLRPGTSSVNTIM